MDDIRIMSEPEHTPVILRTFECLVCGWCYEEADGDPDNGVPAGTRWEDVPEDWRCPHCSAGKNGFNEYKGP